MLEKSLKAERKEMTIFTKNIKSRCVEEGLNLGLKALVRSLKMHCSDFDSLVKLVRENEEYSNVSEEDIRKYY